jgi:hypothetical protein
MELATKPDFAQAADKWERFWREGLDEPLIAAVRPKPGAEPVEKPSLYAIGPDVEPRSYAEQAVRWAQSHDFLGAAIPFVYLELAADQFATFLGVDLKFPTPGEGGWPIHTHADTPIQDVHVQFGTSGRWWRLIADLAEAVMEHSDDSLLLAAPTMVANLDALVALRGAQNVLMDLVDAPDEVVRVLGEISEAHAQALTALGTLLDYEHRGSINRHGMYSKGVINCLQCDFSCMISPAMFQELLLPVLETDMGLYDAVEYHLDGPGAIRHLEALCSLERLGVVQWVAGAADQHRDWSDLYRRIDALGKGLILGGPRESLDRWASELSARRLFWNLSGGDRAEVEATLAAYA